MTRVFVLDNHVKLVDQIRLNIYQSVSKAGAFTQYDLFRNYPQKVPQKACLYLPQHHVPPSYYCKLNLQYTNKRKKFTFDRQGFKTSGRHLLTVYPLWFNLKPHKTERYTYF